MSPTTNLDSIKKPIKKTKAYKAIGKNINYRSVKGYPNTQNIAVNLAAQVFLAEEYVRRGLPQEFAKTAESNPAQILLYAAKKVERELTPCYWLASAETRCEPGIGRRERGGLHGPDDIRTPGQPLPDDRRCAGQREREKVEDAFQGGRRLRHPERAAQNRHLSPVLLSIGAGTVTIADLPRGIVGRRRDHAHLMPLVREPGRHFAGIFADADEFRGKVQAQDENFHRSPFNRLIAPLKRVEKLGFY